MNKKALLEYAVFARKELETQIALSLNKLGIFKDKILKANIVGDYVIIEGNPESFPKRVYSLRKRMISEHFEQGDKFENVVEEFAYTWFNRIIAIRFMEIHDYFPHGFRVLTNKDGSYEPEILNNLPYVLEELKLDENVIHSLRDQNKTEELYRYVLFKQCEALSKVIPDIFDVREPYLELLLPNDLLSQDSVIRKIESIPEEDFLDDVEVVGWLYQYYVASNREEFRKAKVITKDLIPTLSQIFTPDWIVRYMADNSVGRLWLESYPDSNLKNSLKYYVDDAQQDEETQKKIDEIKYKNVSPEDIKIIEPCCGSGHILVYVFDLLMQMYLEKGYSKRDIPSLILKKNLYGLDIDKRAAQLAKFSLIMKARSIDSRFFNEDRFVEPRVFEIKDSQPLIDSNYKESMKSLHFSDDSIKLTEYLVDTFHYAKVIGSVLKVSAKDYSGLLEDIKRCKETESPGIFAGEFYDKGIKRLRYLIKAARVMARKYDVMITNPPYLGVGNLEECGKNYVYKYYPDSKVDMFSVFMEVDYVKKNGFRTLVNPDSWMFLVSFENLRRKLINQESFVNMIHLGMGSFDAVVQTTTFVIRNASLNSNGAYIRLVDKKEKEIAFLNKEFERVFTIKNHDFKAIPGCLIAYWASDRIISSFEKGISINSISNPRQGIIPGNVDAFLRLWHEVDLNKIGFNHETFSDINKYHKKWFLYNKGGAFRRWYGNVEYVINMENEGYDIKYSGLNNNYRLREPDLYFRECISWSKISSGLLSMRYMPKGTLFDIAGCCIFDLKEKQNYVLALTNSKVVMTLMEFMGATLNYEVDQIKKIPVIFDEDEIDSINELVNKNILISKTDWDLSETSIDFQKHPLIKNNGLLSDAFERWSSECDERFKLLKVNEEELNGKFIKIYGLEQDLKKDVPANQVTVRTTDKTKDIKTLISYLIGCLMGRYSLEKEGLIYAGGTFDSSKYGDYLDEDGVLPIYQFVGINDGLTKSICNLVKRIYGDTYYRDNLNFIADALGRKSDEGAEEAINRYLNDSFYADHVQMYQKRPIYWMLNSGKQGAFKCLVYLHRYDKNTLAKINIKYFLPRTALYKAERERLIDQLSRADIAQKKKLEAQLAKVEAAEEELNLYGQVLDHMANQYIELDLDDGVKTNYVKFQGISLEVNGATIKKDLLVPFGLEKQK